MFAVSTDDWGRTVSVPEADAAYYYSYLPSVILDGDLDLTNQYAVTKNWYHLGETANGHASNVFGVGPAVFQSPAFIVGHGLALLSGARTDGFSQWETWFVLWTSVPFSIGAVYLAARVARRRIAASAVSDIAPLIAALAGPVCYYAIRQPGYAHPYATFCVAWLIERWDASFDGVGPRSLRTWIGLGLAIGAASLARPQLAAWCVILLIAVIDDVRRRNEMSMSRLVARWAFGGLVALAVFSPQLFAWQILYSSWYVVPQGSGFMRWDSPAWTEVLFSSRNGLFPWAPLYLFFIAAVFWLRPRRLACGLITGFALQTIVNGAAWDWWGGGSFGGRRFDSAYVVFALGAAFLIQRLVVLTQNGLNRDNGLKSRLLGGFAACCILLGICATSAEVALTATTSVTSARISGGTPASAVWRHRVWGPFGLVASVLSTIDTLPADLAFMFMHKTSLDGYSRIVGVYSLGETFPGLNSYGDKKTDVVKFTDLDGPWFKGLAPETSRRARMNQGEATILIGLNRRGSIRVRLPVHGVGELTIRWNGTALFHGEMTGHELLELEANDVRRGVNALTVTAPVSTTLDEISLVAEP